MSDMKTDDPASPPRRSEERSSNQPDTALEKDVEANEPAGANTPQQNTMGMRIFLVAVAIYCSMFLVALDRTIISTPIPQITNEFHSLQDVGWYAGAYLISSCATQILWGRIFTYYTTKHVFLASIVFFEIGSAICGAAPSSIAFIIGRAVAGLGSAGIFSGTTVILTEVIPLQKRPLFIGLLGSVFGISSIIGPLMGGAFTDHVTWRWCFYINLPIGGLTILVILACLRTTQKSVIDSLWAQILRLDPIGTVVFLPSIICLLLALQWGGTTYPWNNGRIIALLVLFVVLLAIFIAVQIWRKEDTTIPPRIVRQRSVACGTVYASLSGGAMIVVLFSMPMWFQAIRGTTAMQSGIDTLPLVLALVVGAIVSGATISRTGYYVPWMFVSTTLMSVGAGLLSTLSVDTGHAHWIGYQFIFGFGLGVGMQQPSMAAQTVLKQIDVPTGISLIFFSQSLGGAVFMSIGQVIMLGHLSDSLPQISNIDVSAILSAGATELVKTVPTDKLPEVLLVYNEGIIKTFYLAAAISSAMIVPSLGMEWKSVKEGGHHH